MKNTILKISLLILLLLGIISSGSAFLIARNTNIFGSEFTNFTGGNVSRSFEVENISSIKINNEYSDVKLSSYDGDKIIFNYSGEEKDLKINENSNEISIQVGKDRIVSLWSYDFLTRKYKNLEVKVPRTYKSDINVETDAGNIDISGNFKNANLIADAGSINFNGELTSIVAKADAGSINFIGSTDSMDLQADAGMINVVLSKIGGGNYNIGSDVGAINITLPKAGNFILNANTDVGLVNNNFNFDEILGYGQEFSAVKGKGTATISLQTDVGAINIK